MKIKLSLVALAAISSMSFAAGLELYEDVKTKQIYTEPGEGRQKLGNFVQENNIAEMMAKEVKGVTVASKAKKLEFEGTHYLGYTHVTPSIKGSAADKGESAGFEMRRNYLQVKAYVNDKDYFRVTLDTTKELGQTEKRTVATTTTKTVKSTDAGFGTAGKPTDAGLLAAGYTKTSAAGVDTYTLTSTSTSTLTDSRPGYANMFVKYAYLWLDNVGLPNTGAEIGIVHRPWIDYEEHNGWYYRSINKVALEHKETVTEYGPDLVNSADFGINVKSKFNYFTSEIGIFNGEGYHADKGAANNNNDTGMSAEWRLTYHPFGDGNKVGKYDRTKDEYLHISTYGLNSKNHKDDNAADYAADYDRTIYGIHAVYNQPMFLIAGQYFAAKDDVQLSTANDTNYKGYSINGEFRPMKDVTILARYDAHTKETETPAGVKTKTQDAKQSIMGVAYKASKNISYILSGKHMSDAKNKAAGVEGTVYMATAEVKW